MEGLAVKKNIYAFIIILLVGMLLTGCTILGQESKFRTMKLDNLDQTNEVNDEIFRVGIARWLDNEEFDKNINGFKDGLEKVGLVEGVNITFITKSAKADKEKQIEIIDEFIELDVDLIYSLTTPGTLIAKEMTSEIPIVFSIVTYPVETGMIDSLTSSNNNLVGTRNWIHISKQLELLRSVDKNLKNIGFVHRKDEPNSRIQYLDMLEEASVYGIEVIEIDPNNLEELEEMLLNKIDTLESIYMANDTLVQDGEDKIIEIANSHKVMTLSGNKSGLSKGALLGDVVDIYTIGSLSGQKASSILLQGKKASELVTESQRGSFVIVNLKTAKEIGVEIPSDILSRAKLVIE